MHCSGRAKAGHPPDVSFRALHFVLQTDIIAAYKAAPRRRKRQHLVGDSSAANVAAGGAAAPPPPPPIVAAAADTAAPAALVAGEEWAGYDPDCYMMANECEYWAEGTQAWFDATVREGRCDRPHQKGMLQHAWLLDCCPGRRVRLHAADRCDSLVRQMHSIALPLFHCTHCGRGPALPHRRRDQRREHTGGGQGQRPPPGGAAGSSLRRRALALPTDRAAPLCTRKLCCRCCRRRCCGGAVVEAAARRCWLAGWRGACLGGGQPDAAAAGGRRWRRGRQQARHAAARRQPAATRARQQPRRQAVVGAASHHARAGTAGWLLPWVRPALMSSTCMHASVFIFTAALLYPLGRILYPSVHLDYICNTEIVTSIGGSTGDDAAAAAAAEAVMPLACAILATNSICLPFSRRVSYAVTEPQKYASGSDRRAASARGPFLASKPIA